MLSDHGELLRINIECENGLTDLLKWRDRHILSEEQLSRIEGMQSNCIAQNAALLEMLSEHTDVQRYEEFLGALRYTHQSHIANYITADGGMGCR